MQRLIMATGNAHKLREIRQILGDGFEVQGLADIGCTEDIPETANTLEGNALQKARYVKEHYGLDCFADDTGMEVTALGGQPGVRTARFGKDNGYEDNNTCLLHKLQGATDRTARFRTVIALVRGDEEFLFEGRVDGRIATEPRGRDGFGYDPLFEVEDTGLTFAEMGPEEKNRVSHRGRAMQKLVSFLTSILICLTLHAQTGTWALYPSYQIATQNITVGSCVYGLMNGNLLRYDTDDTSLTLYNCLTQLNDVHIAYMAYSQTAKRLILVYDNGNIDLLTLDDEVYNIASLKASTLADKDVTAVGVIDNIAWLKTGFGYITVDMSQGVILNTYRGTQANVDIDETIFQTTDYNLAGGLYWHSADTEGLIGYKLVDGVYVQAAGPIQPNSPKRDIAWRMHYVGNRLLIAGGENSPYNEVYNVATAMFFEDDKWTNFDETTANSIIANVSPRNATNLAQDPRDPTHHFTSHSRCGLWEWTDGKVIAIHNQLNSPLASMSGSTNVNAISVSSAQYDNDGNLWLANQYADTIVRYITPSGTWQSLYFEEIASAQTLDDYLFHSSGLVFLTSRRTTGRGFFAFSTDGTQHTIRSTITNQDGTTYTPDQFYCLAEDQDGALWCGTQLGLFVIDDPTTFFDSSFTFTQIKVSRDDGSGLADYLLSGVPISCIAVDGANRKWIGTQSNGLYLVSADGQEQILHFQADDSPLLSDNIQCLAIHPTTGTVMIGTDAGICSYVADATEAEDELAYDNINIYPNPLLPTHAGLVTIDGLPFDSEVKICSSAGQLVAHITSNGGRATWDARNRQGQRVASGVYHIIVNTADGKHAITARLIII